MARPTLSRALVLALLGAAACVPHKAPPELPQLDNVAFSEAGTTASPTEWWTAFNDPALTEAIDEALHANLDLQAILARMDAAKAVSNATRGGLFPALGAEGEVSTDRTGEASLEVGLAASYEVDLWGRVRAASRAQRNTADAAAFDAQAAAHSLAAQVSTTWMALLASRNQIALLKEQREANARLSELVRQRFMHGMVRKADALRQERLLEQTKAELVAREQDLEVLEHQFAVLLGHPPQDPASLPAAETPLPGPPALPEAGLPSELLQRRPDVLAAERAMWAADAEVASAIANLYPRVTLSAGAALDPTGPLEAWTASLAAGLFAPIFEGGARRANVRRAHARSAEQVATYGSVVLGALQEVEDALTRNQAQERVLVHLDRQVALADEAATNLEAQYTGGLDVQYLDVVTARTAAQQLQRQQIDASQRLLERRIELFRALAGGFELEARP